MKINKFTLFFLILIFFLIEIKGFGEIVINKDSGLPMTSFFNQTDYTYQRIDYEEDNLVAKAPINIDTNNYGYPHASSMDTNGNFHVLTSKQSKESGHKIIYYVFNNDDVKKVHELDTAQTRHKFWLKTDKLNRGHIIYYEKESDSIYYKELYYISEITKWKPILITSLCNKIFWLDYTFDSENNPHLFCYCEYANYLGSREEYLFHARLVGNEFKIEKISGMPFDPSYSDGKIVIDKNDNVLVRVKDKSVPTVYVRLFLPPLDTHLWLSVLGLSKVLYYAPSLEFAKAQHLDRWIFSNLIFGDAKEMSFTFDDDNKLHLIMCDRIKDSKKMALVYAFKNIEMAPWVKETIEEDVSCNSNYDIIVDRTKTIHVFTRSKDEILDYVKKEGQERFSKIGFKIQGNTLVQDASIRADKSSSKKKSDGVCFIGATEVN